MKQLAVLSSLFFLCTTLEAQSFDIGLGLSVEKNAKDTVVVVNKNYLENKFVASEIRLSAMGVVRLLIQYDQDFYMLDKWGTLWRMEPARYRLLLTNLSRGLLVGAAVALGTDLGLMIASQPPVSLANTLPWVTSAGGFIALTPPGVLARLRFFNGANFFQEKLAEGVQSIFRTPSNYEIIFSDSRKNKMMSAFKRPDAGIALPCQVLLHSLW